MPKSHLNALFKPLSKLLLMALLFLSLSAFGQQPHTLLNQWNSNTEGGTTYPQCEQWKITYPTGDEEKDLCTTVASNRQEFYYVNAAGNGIVFRAPIRNDNGTTPNSDNVRSELREREIDGTVDTYWTTSGNHVIYVKQAITHLPINKAHLVATQIHGNKSEGIDDAMVVRLENSHLFLDFNGGVLRSEVTIKTNYSLGTVHEVIFQVIDGKHYCYYSEDGNLKSAFANGNANSYLVTDGGNPVLMDIDYGDAYFKAGNYTQSNPDEEGSDTGNSNNYGEVVIYDLYVDHNGSSNPGTGGGGCSAVVPSNRSVVNVGQSNATLRWTYDDSFNHYNVRYKPTSSSSWTTLTSLRLSEGDFSVSGSLASKTISGLSSNTTYEWQVRAKCDDQSIATEYSDGQGPNFTTGGGSSGGSSFTPDPSKTYYIDAPAHNLRLAASGNSEDAYTTATSNTGADVQWKFVAKGNGSWHVQRAAGGNLPRLRTDNSEFADMQSTSYSGSYTYYEFNEGTLSNTHFFTLTDGPTNRKRLQINSSGQVRFGPTSWAGSWESLRITEASNSGGGGDIVMITKRNAPNYAVDGMGGGENGQNVHLWGTNTNNNNQKWVEIDRGGGYYSYQKLNTNYCLDGNGGGANGQNVHLWTCNANNQNQHWQKTSTSGGAFKLIKRNATGYALNGGSNGTNGQNVNLYNSSNSSYNLQWFITSVGSTSLAKDETTILPDNELMNIEKEILEEESILVFPNPVLDGFTVQIPSLKTDENVSIEVISLASGSLVFRGNFKEETINLTQLSLLPGTYIVRAIRADGKAIVKKIVKM